jgi:hypothetical protein
MGPDTGDDLDRGKAVRLSPDPDREARMSGQDAMSTSVVAVTPESPLRVPPICWSSATSPVCRSWMRIATSSASSATST